MPRVRAAGDRFFGRSAPVEFLRGGAPAYNGPRGPDKARQSRRPDIGPSGDERDDSGPARLGGFGVGSRRLALGAPPISQAAVTGLGFPDFEVSSVEALIVERHLCLGL